MMGIAFDIDIKHATDWRTFAGKMGDVAAQGFCKPDEARLAAKQALELARTRLTASARRQS
jgi:hypothetical protein